MKVYKFAVVTAVLLSFTIAHANIMWDNSSGSATLFDWANGQSVNGFYGSPEVVGGDTFVFTPSNFYAQSLDGLANTASDTLEFELIAHSGFNFSQIAISAYGDYFILGTGEVSATGSLSVQNLDTHALLYDRFTTSTITSGQDTWSAAAQLSIDDEGWKHLKVSLDTRLFAWADLGSAAFIQEKVLGDQIAVQIIPEPATVATLALGLLLVSRKKTKPDMPS